MAVHLFISNSDDMKRVFVLFISFLVVCFVVDRIIGMLLLSAYTNSTEIRKYKECTSDIVIMGSSRAVHHYVPSIISDSLGLSCYNLGHDGKNIYYQYAGLNLLLNHPPKVIIYDCFSVDVLKTENFANGWGALADYYPYYGQNDAIDALINNMGLKNRLAVIISHTYRNNSRFVDYFGGDNSESNGYEPVYGEYGKTISIHYENSNTDSTKIEYMRRLIDLCRQKNIEIVFSVSPRYALNDNPNGIITKKYEVVKKLCEDTHTIFMYYELDSLFLNNPKWFKDIGHLNDEGAHEFTKLFAHDLKNVINN